MPFICAVFGCNSHGRKKEGIPFFPSPKMQKQGKRGLIFVTKRANLIILAVGYVADIPKKLLV